MIFKQIEQLNNLIIFIIEKEPLDYLVKIKKNELDDELNNLQSNLQYNNYSLIGNIFALCSVYHKDIYNEWSENNNFDLESFYKLHDDKKLCGELNEYLTRIFPDDEHRDFYLKFLGNSMKKSAIYLPESNIKFW
jgi:hypothetical protein